MTYDYKTLKALMQGKEYPYQGCTAKIRYIDKRLCKRGYCNVMLEMVSAGLRFKSFTIPISELEQIYYKELTFDELLEG